MFYTLSKVLFFFLQPSSLTWLGVVAGVLLARRERRRRLGLRLALVSAAAMFVAGMTPLSNLLILPLENRFPARTPGDIAEPFAGLIVLGGAEDGWVSAGRGGLAVNEAAERITEAARLARRHETAGIVVTGGVARLLGSDQEGSSAVAALLRDLGISGDRLIVETKSRNTAENATMTLPLIRPRLKERWVLVTSAYHMPRAVGVFRAAGLDVLPYPVDFRTRGGGDAARMMQSLPAGLARFDLVVREWLGLAAYYVTGRTNALFPKP